MKITFSPNGSTMAFENGQQVPAAQEPWILAYARYLESQDMDPTKQKYELPNGRQARVFKTEDGYNWTF